MSIGLRIVLLVASVMTCAYISRKLKKSQIQIMDTVFWIGLSVICCNIAAFPQIVACLSNLLGFMAPVNFVFLSIIFLLLIRCFLLSIRVSQLDDRLKNLVEELALREKENGN